jgi:predicted ArsR family transcriptional regulator
MVLGLTYTQQKVLDALTDKPQTAGELAKAVGVHTATIRRTLRTLPKEYRARVKHRRVRRESYTTTRGDTLSTTMERNRTVYHEVGCWWLEC